MSKTKYIFIRNDDVRDKLDETLIALTDICIRYKIPITHSVEPANITRSVVNWLIDKKSQYPDLIDIIQHGYDHNMRNIYPQGFEFGGLRDFQSQFDDLSNGRTLMDEYFGNQWSRIISFPYGKFNKASMEAINRLEFYAITSGVGFKSIQRMKDLIGRILRRETLFGKRISYHSKKRPGNKIFDIGVSVNVIKSYIDENKCVHYTKDEIIGNIEKASKHTDVIGILFHHRFHKNQHSMIEDLIKELLDSNKYRFKRINEFIIE